MEQKGLYYDKQPEPNRKPGEFKLRVLRIMER